jgi:hypothetical protein
MNLRVAPTAAGRLPNFLLIGAMKAGTTSLYHYLQGHPQVFVPPYKAPEFFVAESNWRRGVDWYRRQFAGARADAIAVGEASNSYAKYPQFDGVPERIAAHIPDVRLIYVVRDPVARIRSHYQTRLAEGTETLPIEEAVFQNPTYLDYSRYGLQIARYLDYFPRQQMLVITAEDLRHNRRATMRNVYEFLGVDATILPGELEREFYQTKDRAVRSPIPLWLRKSLKKHLPWMKRFKELENNLLGKIKRLRRQANHDQEAAATCLVSDALRERIVEQLRDDVLCLRNYMTANFDGWGILGEKCPANGPL